MPSKKYLLFALPLFFMSIASADPSKMKSPFLGDYSSFKKDNLDKNMLVYRNGQKKVSDYSKFIVEPVKIYPSDFRPGKPLTPEDQKMLSDLFQNMLIEELKGKYTIVETPGPDTARLRFAIRDMKAGRYFNKGGGDIKITPDMQLATGSFEMEAVDASTGERILALVRWLKSEEVKGANREKSLQKISDVFADWVKALRTRMDESTASK